MYVMETSVSYWNLYSSPNCGQAKMSNFSGSCELVPDFL